MATGPSFPFFIRVNDYHAFQAVQCCFRVLNPEINVSEVSNYDDGGELVTNPYVGVVYIGDEPSSQEVHTALKQGAPIINLPSL